MFAVKSIKQKRLKIFFFGKGEGRDSIVIIKTADLSLSKNK